MDIEPISDELLQRIAYSDNPAAFNNFVTRLALELLETRTKLRNLHRSIAIANSV